MRSQTHPFHLHFMNEAQMTPPVGADLALNLKGSCIYDENLMGLLSFPLPLIINFEIDIQAQKMNFDQSRYR